jgi:predicted nucleotidyltransferase
MISNKKEKLNEALKELDILLQRNLDCKPIMVAIVGSVSYGLDTENSDIDLKGVYLQDLEEIFKNKHKEQIGDSDLVLYEANKFIQLIKSNNPNIMELLDTPEDCILYKTDEWDEIMIHKKQFLSKICKDSFGGYAKQQISKSRCLNKKVRNPVSEVRKELIDFCYVVDKKDSYPLKDFLKVKGYKQEDCGIINIPHSENMYALYHKENSEYRGLINQSKKSTQLRYSSIPKEDEDNFVCVFYYNQNGFSSHCKDYKEYWEWVKNRNEHRYNDNIKHGQIYDGKNLMHCYRLMTMATEIAKDVVVNVRRPEDEIEQLLKIKKGVVDLEKVMMDADEKLKQMHQAFDDSDLPKQPDLDLLNDIIYNLRKKQAKLL